MIQALEITRYYAETPSSVNYDTYLGLKNDCLLIILDI